MKKLLFPLSLAFLAFLLSCEEDKDTSISYPDEGIFGDNILRSDSIMIEITDDTRQQFHDYSMRAELGEDATLKIIMKKTGGSGGSWSSESSSRIGWAIRGITPGKAEYYAFGPVVCELKMSFYSIGVADIEIYENGSEEPSRIKTISWGTTK
jgi:hypothetical protein